MAAVQVQGNMMVQVPPYHRYGVVCEGPTVAYCNGVFCYELQPAGDDQNGVTDMMSGLDVNDDSDLGTNNPQPRAQHGRRNDLQHNHQPSERNLHQQGPRNHDNVQYPHTRRNPHHNRLRNQNNVQYPNLPRYPPHQGPRNHDNVQYRRTHRNPHHNRSRNQNNVQYPNLPRYPPHQGPRNQNNVQYPSTHRNPHHNRPRNQNNVHYPNLPRHLPHQGPRNQNNARYLYTHRNPHHHRPRRQIHTQNMADHLAGLSNDEQHWLAMDNFTPSMFVVGDGVPEDLINENTEEFMYKSQTIDSHEKDDEGETDQADEVENCAICQYEMKPGEMIRRLPCRHIFHSTCVIDWLLRSQNCPNCRKDITNTTRYAAST